MPVPDYQQKTLYAAEDRFMSEPPLAEAKFADRAEAQQWIERLIDHPDFVAAYPQESRALAASVPEVKVGSATTRIGTAELSNNVLRLSGALGGAGMTLPVMLHEIAHFVHSKTTGFQRQEAHGPEFAGVYLDMVSLVCGEEEARRLKDDFDVKSLRVDTNVRRVSDYRQSGERPPAEGVMVEGSLLTPTDTRTPEKIAAGKAEYLTKKVARQWKGSWKKANSWAAKDPDKPERLMRKFAESNRDYFEAVLEKGSELPDDLREFLGMPPALKTTTQASFTANENSNAAHAIYPRSENDPIPSAIAATTRQEDDALTGMNYAPDIEIGGESATGGTELSGRQQKQRCLKWMTRAKTYCLLPIGHRSGCRSKP